MPLNCKKCGWSQDHFWNERYNPITVLERGYKLMLLKADLDEPLFDYIPASHVNTRREHIAEELERAAGKVRNMRFRTHAELEGLDPSEVICPSCSSVGLEMD